MPIREFECSVHGKFESYCTFKITKSRPCPKCGKTCPRIEFSVPAKRNPRYGEG